MKKILNLTLTALLLMTMVAGIWASFSVVEANQDPIITFFLKPSLTR